MVSSVLFKRSTVEDKFINHMFTGQGAFNL